MARVSGPLFSLSAHGAIGDGLTFSKKKTGQQVRYQKKQDDVFTDTRADVRDLYRLSFACWNNKTQEQRDVFNDIVKERNYQFTGWNYFLKLASQNPLLYLGLAGYWSLNVQNGANVRDISKNNNVGTLGLTYPSSCPTYINGKNDKLFKALHFGNTTDYVTIPSSASLNIRTAITISAWVYLISAYNYANIVSKSGASPTVYQFIFACYGTSRRVDFYADVVKPTWVGWANTQIPLSTWTHVAVTYNGSLVQYYFNGQPDGSVAKTGLFVSSNKAVNIGRRHDGYSIGGDVDEVQIFNRALSAGEMLALYNSFK